MFPRLFPSRGPPVVEKPTRRDADSTTNHTTFHDSRSSTGSSASIADVEAAFLQGESSKRKEWKKACLPSTLLAKLRRSSSNETDSPEKSKRRLRWLTSSAPSSPSKSGIVSPNPRTASS
ncbi:MAG: hypothetical protein LQ348_002078 [Seirophora lacunosa]|nr:MAG: hypothetical protein LQ348_002078 [Seirophora lacunosa]